MKTKYKSALHIRLKPNERGGNTVNVSVMIVDTVLLIVATNSDGIIRHDSRTVMQIKEMENE